MIAYRCTCGYLAASDGELGDHWGEAFIPPDDRDASGIAHAEAARDAAAGAPGAGRPAGRGGRLPPACAGMPSITSASWMITC